MGLLICRKCNLRQILIPTTKWLIKVIFSSEDQEEKALYTLRGKSPNTEFFLVLFFPCLDWMWETMDQKKLRICTLFTKWQFIKEEHSYEFLKYKKLIILDNILSDKIQWWDCKLNLGQEIAANSISSTSSK